MNSSKLLWIILLCSIVAGSYLGGFTLGSKSQVAVTGGNGSYGKGFADGVEEARQKIATSGLIPSAPETVTLVSGKVTAVSKDSITISANPVSPNPLDPTGPTVRTIQVSSNTAIAVLTPLTNAEFTAALEAFNKDTKAGKITPPPNPFKETNVSIGAIKTGMFITVMAAENIKTATTIKALKINVAPTP